MDVFLYILIVEKQERSVLYGKDEHDDQDR